MPIIGLQRRHAEQGRIRLGHKVTGTTKEGKEYTRPDKLDKFRFTSPSERLVREIAELYGGEVEPWDNDGKAEWEVLSQVKSIPVIVVKGGFSQWHEAWARGGKGCIHRCDGQQDPAGNWCDPDDRAHLEAIDKPTTRLSVMLSQIETLGVWRLETKGWNAAAELPSMAELAEHVGDLVPATLSLVERASAVEVKGVPTMSRYVVPMLDLAVTKQRLVELVGGVGGVPAIGGGGVPAIEAGDRPALEARATPVEGLSLAAELELCGSVEDVRALWSRVQNAGHLTDEAGAALKARAAEFTAIEPEPEPEPEPEQEVLEGTVEPEADGDRESAWGDLVKAAGKLGLGMDELAAEVLSNTGNTIPDASAEDFRSVLALFNTGEVKS